MKKIAVILFLIIFVGAFYIVDQYFYSWSGWLGFQAGSCQSKLISASAAGKDGFKRLYYQTDLKEIAAKLSSNPNYIIISDEKNVAVSRNFGDYIYKITFENRILENEEIVYYQISLVNKNSLEGENCTKPDFEIYKKFYRMIDEIPLADKARQSILSDLNIYHQNSS
jgi:hypothetical protein